VTRSPDREGWHWELRFPLALLGPTAPDGLAFNVLRGTPCPVGAFAWSPVFTRSFHTPGRMGRLMLA